MNPRRNRRRRAPQVEALEALELLSTVPTPVVAAPPTAQAAVQTLYTPSGTPLAGSIEGTYVGGRLNRDAGQGIRVTAAGALTGVGNVVATGSLQPTGFIAHGRATGTLTLRNPRGSVTLALTGPIQPGFSALPDTFHYEVAGATGRYAGTAGTGTVDIHLGSDTPSHHARAAGPVHLTFSPGVKGLV